MAFGTCAEIVNFLGNREEVIRLVFMLTNDRIILYGIEGGFVFNVANCYVIYIFFIIYVMDAMP